LVTKLSKKLKGKRKKFKNKRILITAGPTWVPIDKVRVISNIATGETGILLAEKLQRLGNKVTLVLGPAEACCLNRNIKLIRFKSLDELKNTISRELKAKRYDVVIHSAAVSDYRPEVTFAKKIKSGKKIWKLKLVPTSKIIDLLKKIDSSLFLVGFKFEPGARKNILLKKTRNLMWRADLDLAVANSIDKNRYEAYILKQNKVYGPWQNKNTLVNKLVNLIGENLCSS